MSPPTDPLPSPPGPDFGDGIRVDAGLLGTVLSRLPEGLSIVDLNGVHLYVNPALVEMTGFPEEELLGVGPPHPYWPPEEVPRIEAAFGETLAGTLERVDLVFRRRNGERFPVIVTPSRILASDGATLAFFATISDDTERRRMEDALRDSEQRWRSIVENPFDFVVIVGPDYRFQFINRTTEGLRAEDLVGKTTPFDWVDEEQHDQVRRVLERAFREGVPGAYEAYSPALDRWFSSVVGPLRTGGKVTAVSILARDITEAKLAEIALRESERRLDMALRGSTDGLFDLDLATGHFFYSARLHELLGFAADDPALDPRLDGFTSRFHPDDRDGAVEAFERAIERDEPFNHELRLRRKDGTYRWFHGRGRTFRNDGRPVRFAGFVTDIEERVRGQLERRDLEEQLAQSQRMETIGTLAGGIAHDFNNLLLPIMAYTEFAREALDSDHPAAADLAGIAQAAARARDLVQQILAFSRRAESKREPVDVAEIMRETIRFLASSLPSTITIESDLICDCPRVLGDATQIQQVATNLVTNASYAMRSSGGTLRIRVDCLRIAPGEETNGAPGPGHFVRLTVSDTGPGFDELVATRLFEPFFTTKPTNEGSGLGLAVVHGIVRRHGGSIRADGGLGRGATFDVYFPAASEDALSRAGKGGPQAAMSVSGLSILCVDDEPAVLAVLERSLVHLGGQVTVTTSPLDALALLREDSERFDVLVTDQTMPRLTGLDLARAACELRPDLPVLLVTGFSESVTPEAAARAGIRVCLQKPFGHGELATALGEVLAAGRSRDPR